MRKSKRVTLILAVGAVVAFAHMFSAGPAHASSGEASISAGRSHALMWNALGGDLICGVRAHAASLPATHLFCASQIFPDPGDTTEGDPGFLEMSATGRAEPTRASQYSWQDPNGWDPKSQATLSPGRSWSFENIGVVCSAGKKSVRCVNKSGKGFEISRTDYRAIQAKPDPVVEVIEFAHGVGNVSSDCRPEPKKCRGSIEIKRGNIALIHKQSYSIPAGKLGKVKLRLTKAGKKALSRSKRVKATLIVIAKHKLKLPAILKHR